MWRIYLKLIFVLLSYFYNLSANQTSWKNENLFEFSLYFQIKQFFSNPSKNWLHLLEIISRSMSVNCRHCRPSLMSFEFQFTRPKTFYKLSKFNVWIYNRLNKLWRTGWAFDKLTFCSRHFSHPFSSHWRGFQLWSNDGLNYTSRKIQRLFVILLRKKIGRIYFSVDELDEPDFWQRAQFVYQIRDVIHWWRILFAKHQLAGNRPTKIRKVT